MRLANLYARLGTLAAMATALATAPLASAAVTPIDSVTATPAPASATTPVSDATLLTSITAGGTTYSDLAAPQVSGWAGGIYWYTSGESNPGTREAALGNLQLTTGLAGSGEMGGTLVFDDPDPAATFFLFEVNGDNSYTVEAIDANGDPLGLSRTFSASDYGPTVFTAATPIVSSTGSPAGADFALRGLTFTLADLDGTGSATGFAGFEVSTTDGDLAMLGVVVPEPASLGLLGVGGLALLGRRRRV